MVLNTSLYMYVNLLSQNFNVKLIINYKIIIALHIFFPSDHRQMIFVNFLSSDSKICTNKSYELLK